MWNLDQARHLYNLAHWGSGYFAINEAGNVVVRPHGGAAHGEVDLIELARHARGQGLRLPILVRFTDILRHRVDVLCDAFRQAMDLHDYRGDYTAVYPIKVNQQSSVVSGIVAHGGSRVGLEAGSKPELMAVLGAAPADSIIVCNGYKDRDYIRRALIGTRMGHRLFIVIEKLSELELVIEEFAHMRITPRLGVRVRLASIGAGKWQNTGGAKSKFGLHAEQLLTMLTRLREADMLDSLQLLHCHLGSQIANVRDIQRGMQEVARFYVQLRQAGAPLAWMDVGGGLGVDYEGTRSRSFCSVNYSVREYADNVVRALADVCHDQNQPVPHLITESGRALTAHHALLITNVVDIEPAPGSAAPTPLRENEPRIVRDLWQVLAHLPERAPLETWHDAAHWFAEAQNMYALGLLTLSQRARIESLYAAICHRLRPLLQAGKREHREILDGLNDKLADKYFCNLSVFQSMPDVWAIEQVFPVMPLQRLADPPTRRGVVQDLTCDSDGRIDHYVEADGVESSLPLHSVRKGEEYLLGVFLLGAYQEILGDMHNLFGDTDAVDVAVDAEGNYHLAHAERGDSVDELLRYVHFDIDSLRAVYKEKLQRANLDSAQFDSYLHELEQGLGGTTYLS